MCFRQNFPTVANQKAMIFFLSAAIFRYNISDVRKSPRPYVEERVARGRGDQGYPPPFQA